MKNRFYLGNSAYPDLDNYKVPFDSRQSLWGEVMVDVGSCKGDFLKKHHERFTECFAFEASYENAIYIAQRIQEEEWNNCVVFNHAVAGKTGEIRTLYACDSKDRGSSSIIGGSSHNGNQHNVLTINYEDIFKFLNVEEISLLKVDCEGCEYEFLLNVDLTKVNVMCLEIHDWEGKSDLQESLINHIEKTHETFHSQEVAQTADGKYHGIKVYKRRE